MSTINHHTREISVKIVYYGPGLGGKTSSLQAIHQQLNPGTRGQLVSLATGSDRTLYFDFLPVKARVQRFSVRLQLYTVPGQVHYNSTRKLVLSGADAVVFVADSQPDRLTANEESLANLGDNLREQGLEVTELPLIIQYNKRDVPDAVPVSTLRQRLNQRGVPEFETVATQGSGIFEALKRIARLTLDQIGERGERRLRPPLQTPPLGIPITAPAPPAKAPAAESPLRGSVQRLAEAVEQLAPEPLGTGSGSHPIPRMPSGKSLGGLVRDRRGRAAIVAVENDIDNSDWAAAIRHASRAFEQLARNVAGPLAGSAAEATALASLSLGLAASWLRRLREAEQRVLASGSASHEDALFALLFLSVAAVRFDEVDAVR